MGRIYILPNIGTLSSFTDFDVTEWGQLTESQKAAYNAITNGSFMYMNGLTNIDSMTFSAKSYWACSGTEYYACYKSTNSGKDIFMTIHYTPQACIQYWAREVTSETPLKYGAESVSRSDDQLYISTFNKNPLQSALNAGIDVYETREEAMAAIESVMTRAYPITYRLTNCTGNGPSEAVVNSTVNVDLTFPAGYGIVNPSSDVYVTNNGVIVPSQYSNGVLTFTMPYPS